MKLSFIHSLTTCKLANRVIQETYTIFKVQSSIIKGDFKNDIVHITG